MSDDNQPNASDFVSEPHEVLKAELLPHEFPTEGEWKRAITDRKVMEQAFMEHQAKPDSNVVTIGYPLRGERFVAIPRGADAITFHFTIIPPREVN